jgi:sugar phosphate isomerase/epimerase
MNWRVGVSTGAWVDQDITGALEAIETAGFHAIEVGTPPGHFDPWNTDQVRALATRMSAARIVPVSIHAPFGGFLDLSDPNPHHRHAAVGAIVVAASALRELGGTIVVAHTSDVPREGQDVSRRLSDCASALSVLARSCSQMGMTLAIENPLPHLIGGHPDEFGWVLGQVGDGARACLDTSHATLGNHLGKLLEVTGHRLAHVHVNDHHGVRDEHLAPGNGTVPWPIIGAHLRELRFEGWLILELNREISGSPSALGAARARLIQLLG